MEATTLEHTYLVLKKSVPQTLILSKPIQNLDRCRFKVFHSLMLPLHLRFTFFDEENTSSVYHVLDILDGVFFDLYAVASDSDKVFTKVEIYCDVNVLIHLRIDAFQENLERSFEPAHLLSSPKVIAESTIL